MGSGLEGIVVDRLKLGSIRLRQEEPEKEEARQLPGLLQVQKRLGLVLAVLLMLLALAALRAQHRVGVVELSVLAGEF